jgi:transcriptional regulator with PAS, ATPase and Fis domain
MNQIVCREIEPLPVEVRKALEKSGVTWHSRGVGLAYNRIPKSIVGPWLLLLANAADTKLIGQARRRKAFDVVVLSQPQALQRVCRRVQELRTPEFDPPPPPGFVAHSAAAKRLLRHLHQAAQTSMPVLLTGETGTGKELASRLIHQWSTRGDHTFVPINCAAIPNELMEGELFGYVKGAFSGATRDYDGQLLAGEKGTVFLDEIDDTPSSLQTKLLRVLEDKVVSRLGENVWRKIDFRIIAATNRDLKVMIENGQFGDDLYERFSTVEIVLPPLRERLEDLAPLTLQLIERYYLEDPPARLKHQVQAVSAEALMLLKDYRWPGNVRELRNVIFGALVAKRCGDELLISDLPLKIIEAVKTSGPLFDEAVLAQKIASRTFNLKEQARGFEKLVLEMALKQAQGNAAEAARLLGEVGRGTARDPGGTVRTMMKRLGL